MSRGRCGHALMLAIVKQQVFIQASGTSKASEVAPLRSCSWSGIPLMTAEPPLTIGGGPPTVRPVTCTIMLHHRIIIGSTRGKLLQRLQQPHIEQALVSLVLACTLQKSNAEQCVTKQLTRLPLVTTP